ncbi:hypothetical protein [Eisenibacter elegans]|jgi:hypothetical protein|uniref:hypothetical protein n=1 Tax=Eisenibacter elegans TaxID=997 RepID=UPI000414B822|nr:hypothetical protein [Eisenibacter elegans]
MSSEAAFRVRWTRFLNALERLIGKRPKDVNSILFLIGIQELGKGALHFSKEEKQDLIHMGLCKVMSKAGYYRFSHIDDEGWHHWEVAKPIPPQGLIEQEKLIKTHLMSYFVDEGVLPENFDAA